MSNLSGAQISALALNLIDSVPSAISGTVMAEFADQSRLLINNILRVSIGSNAFSDAYQNLAVNLTAFKTLSRMTGVGANYNWTLGQFSVNKGASSNTDELQAKMLLDQVNMEILGLQQNNIIDTANG